MRELEIVLKPEDAFNDEVFETILREKIKPGKKEIKILRRSLDARKGQIKARVRVQVLDGSPPIISYVKPEKISSEASRVIVVGSGPAGLFAALKLLEEGMKPVILERGKDVRARRRDIAAINKFHTVNEDSNYCFGEGGAGTYSDGKLYTRSKKRGDVLRTLEILVSFGAKESILYDAHPHIGTNKLPGIIQAMREHIVECGGEIHFETRVTDFILEGNCIKGVKSMAGNWFTGSSVLLATGHSSRDIFQLLEAKGIKIEAKQFALGLRVEHSQNLIDKIQYNCLTRGDYLPAASYALVKQTSHGGVFSFCMCPGGFIVPSATQPGEIVVNGMSPSRRNSKYANSGIVVEVGKEYIDFSKPLSGMEFQRSIEQKACEIAGGNQTAPSQRLVDFIHGRVSSTLPKSSYQPGLYSVDHAEILPEPMLLGLREAFRSFGKKMKGFMTNDAQVVGVESRTSSPVRIPRNHETTEHVQIERLFPCGEGAGYAGGIVSAAMDGEKCASNIVKLYNRVSK